MSIRGLPRTLGSLSWLEPWHLWALGGVTVLAYALTRKRGPSLHFSGPAEPYAALESESTCDPTEKDGTKAFRAFVLKNFGGSDLGIIRECGGSLSGHTAGKAWDWGVGDRGSNGARIDDLFSLLFANGDEVLRRAGIMYLIYDRRIWNTRARGWQNYTGSNPHTDHVHFSFSTPGALGETSFYG